MSIKLMVDCGEPDGACQHVGMSRSDDEPLGFLLYRVMAVLRPQVAAELKPLGLGLPEFVCMRILAQHPGLTGAELARGTNVSAQAMNQVLHALEDRGALTRADAAVQVADQRILTRLTAPRRGNPRCRASGSCRNP
jgi:hypothetical protein